MFRSLSQCLAAGILLLLWTLQESIRSTIKFPVAFAFFGASPTVIQLHPIETVLFTLIVLQIDDAHDSDSSNQENLVKTVPSSADFIENYKDDR